MDSPGSAREPAGELPDGERGCICYGSCVRLLSAVLRGSVPLLVPELLGAAPIPARLEAPRLHVVLAAVPELLAGRRVLRPALAALRVVAARRAVWAIKTRRFRRHLWIPFLPSSPAHI